MGATKLVVFLAALQFLSGQADLVLPEQVLELQVNLTEQLRADVVNSINTVVANMKNYDLYVRHMADQILEQHEGMVKDRVESFKKKLLETSSTTNEDIIISCLIEESHLDELAKEINKNVKKCATVVLSEVSNVISDSLNEAQTFMTIPQVIGQDIQNCGLAQECLYQIVGDAIAESVQVPSKVLSLAAKIQQITLRTVTSIDGCALNGLTRITKLGIEMIEDVLFCIADNQ